MLGDVLPDSNPERIRFEAFTVITLVPEPRDPAETMAGDGIGHPAKCLRYGSFMRNLPRGYVEAIFWSLFGLVLLLLIVAGLAWTNSEAIVK